MTSTHTDPAERRAELRSELAVALGDEAGANLAAIFARHGQPNDDNLAALALDAGVHGGEFVAVELEFGGLWYTLGSDAASLPVDLLSEGAQWTRPVVYRLSDGLVAEYRFTVEIDSWQAAS